MSALEVRNLDRRFGSVVAVRDVTLSAPAGSKTVIIGPSGCGKTTLLRLIAGFDRPDAGFIALDGAVLFDAQGGVPAHRRGIGYVPQEGALFPFLSISDNIGFSLPTSLKDRARRIEHLMEMVDLEPGLAARFPHEVSGGQQQRVALARALAMQPRLILLDEPFSALNAQLRIETRTAVAEALGSAGTTSILVTHDQDEALSFADQIIVMRDGVAVQAGTPPDVYSHPVDASVARLLGDAIVLDAELRAGTAVSALGALPTRYSGSDRRAQVILRPSQLVIVRNSDFTGTLLGRAVVTGRDYRGDAYLLRVAIPRALLPPSMLSPLETHLVCSSENAPPIGETVQIGVRGMAHVLANREASSS